MALAAEREMQHIGETAGMADHDHDLVHELNERLDAVWHYDQYIANAGNKPQLQEFWKQLKEQDLEVIGKLRDLIKKEVSDNCF